MIPDIELTREQSEVLDAIGDWYRNRSDVLTLGGYAGVGKTTILGQLRRVIPAYSQIAFASYTGKAVTVLKNKLPPGSDPTTLHRLLYMPHQVRVCRESGDEVFLGTWCEKHRPTELLSSKEPCEVVLRLDWSTKDSPLEGIDLVVVDEASMVSDKIWSDLTRWGVPILAVGDHAQLPPIKSEFNLMEDPELRLETILRQVADSPIIKMSILAREEGRIRLGEYGDGCEKIRSSQLRRVELNPSNDEMILCGYNRTRNELNRQLRRQTGHSGPPESGDIVICLRNSYEHGVFNGMRGRIKEIEPVGFGDKHQFAVVEMWDQGFDFSGEIAAEQFGQPKTMNSIPRRWSLFDYGYALTVHKSQGSEASRVIVIEEKLPQTDYRRWLYTAVTRASKQLIVVGQ